MSYQKFTKDIGIIGLTELMIALKGLIVLPIVTKLLGPENYGIWAQLIITLSLITPIAILGLPYTLVRFLAAEKNKKEIQDGVWSVFIIIFGVTILIALILLALSGSISSFLGGEKILVQILAFVIILECLNQVYFNIFRAFQEVKRYSSFMIFQAIGEVGLVSGTVLLGYGLLGAVLSLLIIRGVNFLAMSVLTIQRIGFKLPKFLRIKEYLRFSLPTIPGNISNWIVQSSDRYLIGFFLGTLFVGYYVPAYVIGNSITFFIMPLIFVLPAVLSKFYDENKINEVKIYLKYSLKYFLMIGIPSVFGLSILSKQLLTIFSTSEIAQQSYHIVPFVALSILLFGIYAVTAQIISLKKKTKITGMIWMGAAFLNLGLNFVFIPRFGILGAAITTLAAYTLAFILTWYYSFKEFQFDIDWKFILKSVFASILMISFIFWLGPIGLLKTITAIFVGALIYGFLIFLFKGFNRNELKFLKELLRIKA
jgi:O-antigen/teichoic acid export membrane protein